MVQSYRDAIANRCTPVGAFVNEQVNSASVMYCAPTDEQAIEEGQAFAEAFFLVANQTMGIGSIYPTLGYQRGANAATSGTKTVNRRDMPIGSPGSCIDAIRRWEQIGVDRMVFLISFDNVVPIERIKDSLRLFAAEVMPAFSPELTTAGTIIR
jgi:alkanesulfonate monooxygenase SsuD/methylene tetrahydromethanopterin reductase-like flavin-dependent oxidoreductase (luciferase family)